MSTPSQSTEPRRWFGYSSRDALYSLANPCRYENSFESPPQGLFTRLQSLLFPLILVQILGLTQGLTQMAGLGLINNAVQKPILEYLLRSLILLFVCNPLLLWLYGPKNYFFVYEARSWTYLLFVILDFVAYRLQIEGETLMPRAYVTCLPALITILTLLVTSILLHIRYSRYQYFGIGLSIASLGLVIWGDQTLSLNYFTNPQRRLLTGTLCTLSSCIFKALSYLTLEAILRQYPILEVLSFSGLFGLIISFLFMVFVDSYEFVSINWFFFEAGYLFLSGLMSAISLLLTAKLAQIWGATFSSLAAFTSRPWFMGLGNLSFVNIPSYTPQFQHVLAYFLVLVAEILFLYIPVIIVHDNTYKLDFYRRPH